MSKLAAAARAAFTQVRAAHPKEHFYVFALFAEDGDLWQPTANSEEKLGKRERWFAEDFAYHQVGEEHFARVGDASLKKAVAALRELEDEGFFGRGKKRDEVAVLVLRSDQASREVVEAARVLNPLAVVTRIEAAFPLEEPTGDPELFPGKPAYSIDSLALSGDGKVLVAAGWFGGSELYRYRLGKAPALVKTKTPKVAYRCIALDHDGTTLFGATEKEISKNGVVFAKATDVSWLAVDGDALHALESDATLRTFDVATGKLRAKKKWKHDERVQTTRGALTATGSYDPKKPIVVFEGGKAIARIKSPGEGVSGLAFSPSTRLLAAANEDGFVRVWNWRKGSLELEVRGRQEAMSAVVFLSEDRIAGAGRDVANGPPVYAWKL